MAHSQRADQVGPKKPNFKLQERRGKKLELSVGVAERMMMVMASPVSPLEMLARGSGSGSPRTPHEEEEERAIAEKGFYLHPSPLSTPRSPQLLPLFPLHSPTHTNNNHS
uniref:Uncharacterized protein n=2 Tax=Cajanus cajan TaxID=3821 RepID=A0A151RMP3_CAJCA|nr:hypothetical protein KK1_034709 [Cajanus cajan]